MTDNQDDSVEYFGSGLSAVVIDLQPGQEYAFRVKATSLVGDGPWSDLYQFLIVDKPSSPLNLMLISFDNTEVSFSWEQPIYNGGQALSGFNIYIQDCSDPDNNDPQLLTSVSPSTFSYTDSSVIGGMTYCYSITAYNSLGGESQPSSHL